MTDTIKPPNAISIWASSTHLYADCPSPDGRSSHMLKLALEPSSFTVLLSMLASRTSGSKIGEKGDLTKHQIRKQIRELTKGKPRTIAKAPPQADPEIRMSVRDILRKAGY